MSSLPGLPPINFAGLTSGIDTNSIITQLAALERQQEVQYTNQQTVINKRQGLYADFATKISAVQTAATALKDLALFTPTSSVTTTDASALTASYGTPTGETAIPGSYDVAVTQLARNEVQTQQSAITQAGNSDTLNVSFTTLTGTTSGSVAIAAGDTLQTIAQKLNDANLGFTADVSNGKLRLNGAGSVSITGGTTGNGYDLATDLNLAVTQTHLTANFSAGGSSYTRDTNTVNDALAGVTFTMLKNGSTTTINVGQPGPDPDKVVAAVKSFVDAYNTAYGAIHDAVNEQTVVQPKTVSDLQKGTVFGDPTLNSLMQQMRGALQGVVTGLPASLNQFAEIGISTGASTGVKNDAANAGTLVFDEAKLRSALTSDPTSVKKLIGQVGVSSDGSDSGLGQRFNLLLQPYTLAATGIFASSSDGFDSTIKTLKDSVQRIENSVTRHVAMWQKQFSAMEQLMSKYKSVDVAGLFPTSGG